MKKKDIRELLWDRLLDALSESLKEHKVSNLSVILRKNRIYFMIVNARRKWYNKKIEFNGGEENDGILTLKKYLSTWNCVK